MSLRSDKSSEQNNLNRSRYEDSRAQTARLSESDYSLNGSSETTKSADSQILNSSSILEESSISNSAGVSTKADSDRFVKWFPKTPQYFLKSWRSKKDSRKSKFRSVCTSEDGNQSNFLSLPSPIEKEGNCPTKVKPRLICSSEVQGSIEEAMLQLSLSPIEKEGEGKSAVVDRIDYSNLAEEKIIPTFLTSRTCYDVMPTSGKVVVLSLELLVKNAFEALVSNELRAAPLWNSATSSFVGMLTISDFINVLRHYYRNAPEDIKDIESQSIATWRKMNKSQKSLKINGMDNLAQATKMLIKEGVHRIAVLDDDRECVLFILTRKRLLHYIYYNIIEKFGKSIARTPKFLNQSIRELGVGTFSDIATVTYKTTVIEALDLFMQRNVSALPIVDENNTVLDIFAKFDVFALAKEQTYHNLDMTIGEAIDKGTAFIKVHEDVYGCSINETLGTVIQAIVTSKAHRLVMIDEKKTPIGMVSLSDILKFIVVQPLGIMEELGVVGAADIIEEAPEGAVGGAELDDNVFLDPKQKSDGAREVSESDVQEVTEEEEKASEPEESKDDTVSGSKPETSDLAE